MKETIDQLTNSAAKKKLPHFFTRLPAKIFSKKFFDYAKAPARSKTKIKTGKLHSSISMQYAVPATQLSFSHLVPFSL